MKIQKLLTLLFFVSTVILSQEDDFPQLDNSNFENITIETSKFYNGNSLWGLINGGADLYLEYGFDKLLHQQVRIDNKDYRIEIYKMLDPLSAFGIFSISKFKCDSTASDILLCITKYQTQGVKGSYYISISNSTGADAGKKMCQKIYDKITDQIITESKITKENLFPIIDITMDLNSVKYLKGQLAVQNGYPMWSAIFEGCNNFTVSIFPFDKNGKEIVIGQINFENESDAASLLAKENILTETQSLKKLNSKSLLLIDSEIPVNEIYTLLNLE